MRQLFFPLLFASLLVTDSNAQQITLDWATPVVPANNRVKFAANGDVFALGTGTNSAVIQRFSATGTLLWTKTLSAPSIYAIDMDVDASDNIFIYVGLTTGQLDLDPGPNVTLVNPGKVYAKYSGSGQFQWGFSVENTTDLSEDYGGISCDDVGNLYITGDLGEGTYDMDPGPDVSNLVVGNFTTGSFIARYRADGSFHWADVRTWYSGFSNSRDIAAMRDGTSFMVIQDLDNGGPSNSLIDVDPGPGVVNVTNESTNLLQYDSTFAFVAKGDVGYGDMRLCLDAQGSAYLMAKAFAGAGFWALKYNRSGQSLSQVYNTSLTTTGNLRLGDIAPDEQGGCMGMYSNNCTNSRIRFYKMNVSGLVDMNLFLNSGTDCTLPGGKGFDLRGGSFVMGTYNQNYAVDFDPGTGILNLPSITSDDGVVARYDWCALAPFDPFEIETVGAVCMGGEATFSVDAFGDASGYTWTVNNWDVISGNGTDTIVVDVNGMDEATISVVANNSCGSSAPIAVVVEATTVTADLPDDQELCAGNSMELTGGSCANCTYLWAPGGETSESINVVPTETTMYTLTVSDAGCSATDSITIMVDPCLGMGDAVRSTVQLAPVPTPAGEPLHVSNLSSTELIGVFGADGRAWAMPAQVNGSDLVLSTNGLPAGTYSLRATMGRAWRFVVVR